MMIVPDNERGSGGGKSKGSRDLREDLYEVSYLPYSK